MYADGVGLLTTSVFVVMYEINVHLFLQCIDLLHDLRSKYMSGS